MGKPVKFTKFPLAEKTSCGLPIPHAKWFRAQFRYFKEDCKLRREQKIEDFALNNFSKIHILRDNPVLESIVQCEIEQAELLIITDQRFSRLSTKNIIKQLGLYLDIVPNIYFCLNKHYLNYNDAGEFDNTLPDDYDQAILMWLRKNLSAKVYDLSANFKETGTDFTWVIPSKEYLICRD